jgi:hypothetical protein
MGTQQLFAIQHQRTLKVLVQIETTFTGVQSAAAVLLRPYSELGLVLPSKTPAKRESVDTFAFAATAKGKLA